MGRGGKGEMREEIGGRKRREKEGWGRACPTNKKSFQRPKTSVPFSSLIEALV